MINYFEWYLEFYGFEKAFPIKGLLARYDIREVDVPKTLIKE